MITTLAFDLDRMKKLLTVSLVLFLLTIGVWFIKSAYFPTHYIHGDWMEPFDRHLRKFDFANYELPVEYEMVTYRSSDTHDQSLLLYKDKTSRQLLALVSFREHHKVDLNQVQLAPGAVRRAFWRTEIHPVRGNFFAIETLLPFGYRDDIENSGRDLNLRGISVDEKESFSTEKTDALYIKGEFSRLRFDKRSDTWRPYVTPVLDFMGDRKGAIAIINDKKTGKTLFAIGCNYKDAPFDEEEFKGIVRSVGFEATPLPEAFSHIKGLTRKTTVTRKTGDGSEGDSFSR